MRGSLSHCVSCSSCGPPRASWAVGGIPALGPRVRWKPLSVPTLPGKPPPRQLPCRPLLGCGVGDAVTQGETLTHPPTGLYPWWEREEGGKGEGAEVGSTQDSGHAECGFSSDAPSWRHHPVFRASAQY